VRGSQGCLSAPAPIPQRVAARLELRTGLGSELADTLPLVGKTTVPASHPAASAARRTHAHPEQAGTSRDSPPPMAAVAGRREKVAGGTTRDESAIA
jgi:hypothetical protein